MIDEEPPKPGSSGPSATSPQVAQITAEVTSLVISQVSKFFSGPLPPPEILAGYNAAFPDAAQRIVAMAESQQKHRQNIEAMVVQSNCNNERLGQLIGGTVAVLSLLIGGGLMACNKSAEGFGVIVTTVATLAGVFVYSRFSQKQERAEKMKPFLEATGRKPIAPPTSPDS